MVGYIIYFWNIIDVRWETFLEYHKVRLSFNIDKLFKTKKKY